MSEETFRWVVAGAVVLATLSMVGQAIVSIIILGTLKRAQAKIDSLMNRAEPLVVSVKDLLDDTGPKIKAIAADSVEVARLAREQAARVSDLVKDITDRAKVQVARIDGAMDETMEQVQTAGTAVKGAVLRPVRELSGIVSGVRAAVGVITQGRRASVDHATQDEEMFI